ncbi:MAG: tetratricopeptide repeat protein, partial [Planctomycetota bacterium]
MKRHRIPVVTAAVLALLALSALVGASGGLMWALSERSIAQRALEESQRSKRESDALNGLLREAFATPSPRSLGRTATALDVLDNASQILLSGAVGAPNDKPSLLISLAETMLDVGEHDRAVELLRRAQLLSLERRIDGRRQYAHATTLLSLTLLESGRADEALREISSVSGVDDETSVVVTDRDPELALLQSDVWLGLGRPERAIALLDRIDASWSMSYRDLLGLAIRRANAAMLRGRYSEAIRMVRDARARSGEELDDADPAVIRAERVLAAAFLDAGSLGEAIRTLRDLHDVAATRFGPGHVRTLEIADDLMRAALHSGEIEGSTESTRGAAVSLDSFAIEQGRIARESLREGHPLRERILAAGGRLLRAAGRPEEAERLMLGRADPGGLAGGAPRSFEELYFEGRELLNVGRFDDAIGALERARVASVGTPDSSVRLIDLRVRLIDAYASRGDLDGAVEVLEELLARSRPETEFALGRVIEAVHTVVISAAGDPRFEPRADRALDLLLERADAIFVATEWDTGRRELTEVFAEVAARRGREFGERLLVERRRVFLSNLREPT